MTRSQHAFLVCEKSYVVETLLESFPTYAKDIKLNLSSVLKQTELTPQQLWGTALACAIASGSKVVLDSISVDSRESFTGAGCRRGANGGRDHVDEQRVLSFPASDG